MQLQLISQSQKTAGRLGRLLKKQSFLFLGALLLLGLLGVGLIFYLYVFRPPVEAPSQQVTKADRQLYERVLTRLNARNNNIQQGIGQDYRDVFK